MLNLVISARKWVHVTGSWNIKMSHGGHLICQNKPLNIGGGALVTAGVICLDSKEIISRMNSQINVVL